MEMSTLTRTLLFDTYGEMLTEKQRVCFSLRYDQDLSLGEISELEGVSRQAVRDNILRSENLLQEMEEKIGAVRRLGQIKKAQAILADAVETAKAMGTDGAALEQKITEALDCIKE